MTDGRERWEKEALLNELDTLRAERDQLAAQVAANEYALRTRPYYNLRCQRCGAPHNLETSIPIAVWNQIVERDSLGADKFSALCTLCINDLMAEKGLTCEAEFYFMGSALQGRLYAEDETSRMDQLAAQVEKADALVSVVRAQIKDGWPRSETMAKRLEAYESARPAPKEKS